MTFKATPAIPIPPVPSMQFPDTLTPFQHFCQHVLPAVYSDELSYYELLCKVTDYLNKTMANVNGLNANVQNLYSYVDELQKWVDNYFTNLDVQEEINNKLDQMAKDGTLANIFNGMITFTVDVVNDLKTYSFGVGSYVNTRGFYEVADGGAATYQIVSGEPDGIVSHPTSVSGQVAMLVREDTMHLKSFGAKGDGTADDTDVVKKAIDFVSPWEMNGTVNGGHATGGHLVIDQGKYLVTDTIYVNPLLEIEGYGCQRAGVGGIGYVGSLSEFIFDIPVTNKIAIGICGLVKDGDDVKRASYDTEHPGTDIDNATLGQLYGFKMSNLSIRSKNDHTICGISCIGAVGLFIDRISVIGFRWALAMNSSWYCEITNSRFNAIDIAADLRLDVNQSKFTACTFVTGNDTDYQTYPRMYSALSTDTMSTMPCSVQQLFNQGVSLDTCDYLSPRAVFAQSCSAVVYNTVYAEGPIQYGLNFSHTTFTVDGCWFYGRNSGGKCFNFITFANGTVDGVVKNANLTLYSSSLQSGKVLFNGVPSYAGVANSTYVKVYDSNTIYVSANGDDANGGMSNTPVKTLVKAFSLVEDGGTIVLLSDITVDSTATLLNKSIIIQGNYTITVSTPILMLRNTAVYLRGVDITVNNVASAFRCIGNFDISATECVVNLNGGAKCSLVDNEVSNFAFVSITMSISSINGTGYIGYSASTATGMLAVVDGSAGITLTGGVATTKYNGKVRVLNA